MKPRLAIPGLCALLLSVAANADIVTLMPGVAGQEAVQGSYFAVAPAVRVTTDAGVPIPGKQVNFWNHDSLVMFTDGPDDLSAHDFGITDENGVATTAELLAYVPGIARVDVFPQTENVLALSVDFTVLPGGARRVEVVSGSQQRAVVGTDYPLPWVARVVDASGNGVRAAAVTFHSTVQPNLPSVTFNGEHSVWVRADDNGIAVSPSFRANMIPGQDEGVAMASMPGTAVESAFFEYTNLPAGTAEGCGRQGKGNGDCGNSPAHSGGNGNNGKGNG